MKPSLIYSKTGLLFVLFCFLSINGNAQETTTKTALYNGTQEGVDEDEIRILSYNIKMLPRLILRARFGTIKRSRKIPQAMIDDQIDIIVFQEAFDVRSRRLLKRGLKKTYPYKIGPANNSFWRIKTNSGILMYSKYPMKYLEEIDYDYCEGEDCLARKGALLVEVDHPKQKFQVMGTHLEAGGTAEGKITQYEQIRTMILKHEKEGIPQFMCGDYNTHKPHAQSKKNHKGLKKQLYSIMIDTLDAVDEPLVSDYVCTTNPFERKNQEGAEDGKCEIIDFILVRDNGVKITQTDRYVRRYKELWSRKKNLDDLSDHNAILMRLRF